MWQRRRGGAAPHLHISVAQPIVGRDCYIAEASGTEGEDKQRPEKAFAVEEAKPAKACQSAEERHANDH